MNQLEIALGEIGTLEDLSAGSNPRVLEYFAKIGQGWVHEDSVAWCAAFVGFCLETAGIASTKALNARSYLQWGKPTTTPKLKDLVVFWRISPHSAFGHVAFFIRQQGQYVWVLGGNQSDSVCIEKYPLSQVLSYRTI